jgi:hypothetical protein
VNGERRIKASTDVVSRVVDGEAVLLDLASGKYFGLNEVGSSVWEHVQEELAVATLLERLLDEFDVEAPALRSDVDELLAELQSKGLISVERNPA